MELSPNYYLYKFTNQPIIDNELFLHLMLNINYLE